MLTATPDVIETFDIQTPILMSDYRIDDIVSTGPERWGLVAIKVAFVLDLDVAVLFLLVRAYAGVFWGGLPDFLIVSGQITCKIS